MFTGIVQAACAVAFVEKIRAGMRYGVQCSDAICEGLNLGASVSVDGVCQTVMAVSSDHVVQFEAVHQTLRITSLSALQAGQRVNVERSAVWGQEVGGHLLSGHVNDVVVVIEADLHSEEPVLVLEYPEAFSPYLFDKGYVGVHGCSLTIHCLERAQRRFSVYLIPETLRITNLSEVRIGDKLNLEIDRQTQAIVDTVERVLSRRS